MNRRELFVGLASAAASPLTARAQQATMPVIGVLRSSTLGDFARIHPYLSLGLKDGGFVEGENLKIEHRWADGRYERLPDLAAEMVRRQVAAIIAISDPAALAAKGATTTVPIVFNTGSDPVKIGLVDNLSRPSGNLTGLSQFNSALLAKRLELVRELAPEAATVAYLTNPTNTNAQASTAEMQTAAQSLGRQLHVVAATNEAEIDGAFASIAGRRIGAIVVGSDPFFLANRNRLVELAARYSVPTLYTVRDYALAGGLVSYAANQPDLYRQTGVYAGRILKGAKPPDLPIMQPTRFDLVVNLKTARAIGVTLPTSILLRADEVIE